MAGLFRFRPSCLRPRRSNSAGSCCHSTPRNGCILARPAGSGWSRCAHYHHRTGKPSGPSRGIYGTDVSRGRISGGDIAVHTRSSLNLRSKQNRFLHSIYGNVAKSGQQSQSCQSAERRVQILPNLSRQSCPRTFPVCGPNPVHLYLKRSPRKGSPFRDQCLKKRGADT